MENIYDNLTQQKQLESASKPASNSMLFSIELKEEEPPFWVPF